MKQIAAFALIGALTTAGAVSAQDATPSNTDPFVATVGPAIDLTPGLAAIGVGVIIVTAFVLADNNSSSGTD